MNMHSKIMNIQTDLMDVYMRHDHAYKMGHRDARHQAAEIVVKYDDLITKLFSALNDRHADDLVDELKEEFGL